MLLFAHLGSAVAITPVTVALFLMTPEHLWIPGLWVLGVIASAIIVARFETRHRQRLESEEIDHG